jgi:hypothetical protein
MGFWFSLLKIFLLSPSPERCSDVIVKAWVSEGHSTTLQLNPFWDIPHLTSLSSMPCSLALSQDGSFPARPILVNIRLRRSFGCFTYLLHTTAPLAL